MLERRREQAEVVVCGDSSLGKHVVDIEGCGPLDRLAGDTGVGRQARLSGEPVPLSECLN